MAKAEDSEVRAQLKTLTVLRSRQEHLFQELTRLKDSLKPSLPEAELEVVKHSCLRYENTLDKLMDDIFTANASVEKAQQISTREFSAFRTLIDSILKKCYAAKKTRPAPRENEEIQAHLPRLSIPTWEGEVSTWTEFKTQFDSIVGQRKDITEIVKLQYLRTSLRGEPLAIVAQYPLAEDSYQQAYDALITRYANPRRLASYHLNKILTFKSLPLSPGREHVKFLEVHRAASAGLNQLKAQLADFLLFELSYNNLSPQDRKRFDIDHADVALPNLQGLFSFVEKMARSEELSIDKEPPVKAKVNERSGGKPQITKRSLVASKRAYVCYHCKGDHMLHRCPKFLAFSVDERKVEAERLGCCIACLYKHPKRACKSKFCCKICGSKYHNTVLHPEGGTDQTTSTGLSCSPSNSHQFVGRSETTPKTCNNCRTSGSGSGVLLGTIQCRVQDGWGQDAQVRAVLDPGSEVSVITSSLANRLGLPKTPAACQIEGVGRSLRRPLGNVRLRISPLKSSRMTYQLQAAILPDICEDLPRSKLSSRVLERFKSLELADPQFFEPGRIHLLLGADAYSDLLSNEEPTIIPGSPAAIRTLFGYVITGRIREPTHETCGRATSLCLSTVPLNDSIKRFWEIEEVSEEIPSNPADVLCEQHFNETHHRDATGRFVVRLPFLPDVPPLGTNEEIVMKRLNHLERRLKCDPDLAKMYQDCLQEYIDLGHISIRSEKVSYLLPHHAVFKQSSSTTKCRVVFDCSAPDDSGISLNDRLYRGPPLLKDISLLMINFRLFEICLMADIKMMYRMVVVHPEDRKNLVIAWRGHQYQMNRLPFGLKPAGYLAGRCIIELANLFGSEFPAAARAIRENRYADDFCTGAGTLEDARELRIQLTELLSRGGFEIRRWSSNCPEALSDVPDICRETPIKLPSGEVGIKVLGVMWDQSHDAFVARIVPFNAEIISKRTILSYIARIYDVMGFFGPTIFLAKCFIQRLWLQQLDWDAPLPKVFAEEWRRFTEDLSGLSDIRIPRSIPAGKGARLVGFSDASEKGMAAVVYLQWSTGELVNQSRLLMSKTKLAPLKTLTIPRLELCGALLLAKLIRPIIESFRGVVKSTNLYTDSKIVLAWLNHPPHELKIFVGNRVAQIQRLVPSATWGHVSSEDNPADLGSRGLSADLLKDADLWWNGPYFLSRPYHEWPGMPTDLCPPDQLPEIKELLSLNLTVTKLSDGIIRRFSSFSRMQRVLAYMLRFANRSRRSKDYQSLSGPLSTAELENALYVALRLSQREGFSSAIEHIREGKPLPKELRKLSPFFDHRTGLLRVGGRLGRIEYLPEDTKHPFLLPKNCHVSALIVDHYHQLYLHSGPRTTCAAVQRKFWILSIMSLVKARIHRCHNCQRLSLTSRQPIMADIIPARAKQTYCWSECSLDFGGPFLTRESNLRKSTRHKSYMCIFVCLATKSVHLEMVSDLTTAAFLAAFSRFTARRSVPRVIYSDRGRNFVGARKLLQEADEFLRTHEKELLSAAAASGTSWRLNAPYSPNFNGCAENGIKSAKALLKRQVGEQILTFEEFQTLLCRVEQVLNSRPIAFSRDARDRDVAYLTPGHFITGRELMTPPEEPLDENTSLRDRWRRVRQMAQSFWKAWSIGYLHELMQRQKWNTNAKNVQVGDIVYVREVNTSPLSWPLGKVVETFTNPSDSTIRVVRVRVRGSELVRPVTKLIVVPMEE